MPMTICAVASTTFTPTLTQVLRAAAVAARSAGLCSSSSGSSSGGGKAVMVRAPVLAI